MVTPDWKLPQRESGRARFARRHFVLTALGSGGLMGLWGFIIFRDGRPAAFGAVVLVGVTLYQWNPHGPLRRRQERLYDDDGVRRPD